MTASRPPFSYHPLDEDTHEIRLIELIPKVDDKNPKSSVDEIQCELVHVKHRSTPADQDVSPPGLDDSRHGWGTFAALSYVWGSIELPKRHIALSGSKFEVTLNLHNALTRLVRLVREDESFPRRVWIDAICIDQGNVDERNKQVPRMRYIYGAASVVVCSLPPEWNVTSKADARAKTMGWDAGAKMVPLLSAAQSDVGAKTLAEHLSTGLVQYSSHGWASLFKFFANPYWTRLWIIQEIALASREILVLAGHNRIPWEKVANAAALFRGLPYATRESVSKLVRASGKSVTPFSSNIDNIVELQRLRTQRIQHEPHPHPSTAIRLARKAQATNERDKVYGILSLVDPSLSEQIHEDYGYHMD
ncbi:hypothetical protein PRZ48_013953 [Zasmidium cellare]|uniref:Heterokaryon incompatibility domain-containing protein n=1 Tax=Zasmidium cellare TaxID=395010 RepID=A0ABR0DZM6_ZASCE|nr:hypothetical protein PRZ48_013953 [Zasmidium cellare]